MMKRAYIVENVAGVFGLGENREIIYRVLFSSTPEKIVEKIESIQSGQLIDEVKEVLSTLKQKGFQEVVVEDQKLAKNIQEQFDIHTLVEKGSPIFKDFRENSLSIAKEEGIKTNVIIMNNSYLGMVRQWLEIFFHKRYSQVWLGKIPDFVKVAEAYGLKGLRVTKPSELGPALKESVKSDVTTVIDVKVEQESNILPMLPPGGHLKEAFGGCIKAQGQFF